MKLLIVNYEFPPLGGGAGNANYYIAKEMAKKGHDILVLTSQFKGLPKEEIKDGFKIIRIPTLRKKKEGITIPELLVYVISSLWFTPQIAKKFNPDKSLAFFGLPCGIATLYLKIAYKIPYVVSLRGADVPGFVERNVRFYHFIAKPLIRFIWKQALCVVTNSSGLMKLARKTVPNARIEIIPNGADSSFFYPDQKPFSNSNKLLFVGRLSKQKGLSYLVNSLKILKKNLNNSVHLEIVGEGPDKNMLIRQFQENQLEDMVSFAGWVEKDKILEKYQQASVFVFPSLSEGMPNVVLEAMASGLPVVATRIAGNEELVRDGENGYLVPEKDSETMADKLIDLIKDSEKRKKMGEKSRRIVLDEYTWESVADKYLKLLESKDRAF